MGILNHLVVQMNKEEARHLKLYLNRTSASGERKDELLFDYIRKSSDRYDEDKILQKLYGSADKNAFYRLKNRLKEDIGKSISLQYFAQSDINFILYNLALSRHFHAKQQYDIAFHYLGRAEKKASTIKSHEMLDLIYSDYIKLSHETLSINPEEYIEKRKENREHLKRIQEIDDILAALIYRIKISQNYSKKEYKVLQLLQKTVNDFTSDPNIKHSSAFRFKIYQAVSRILLQQRDYISLEEYLKNTLKTFEEEGLFSKNNHDTKLQMLIYLSNSLYKNGKMEESLKYTHQMKDAMMEFGKMLHDKYLFYYYNSLAGVYAKLNREKAIEILLEAKDNKVIQQTPINGLYIHLQLMVHYFDLGENKKAIKNLSKSKVQDNFTSLDKAFQLKIHIAELIIRYELEDTDYLEYLVKQIKKDFEELLTDETYLRQKYMIDIIGRMIYHDAFKEEETRKKAEELLGSASSAEAEDSDLINYNSWLSSKLNE